MRWSSAQVAGEGGLYVSFLVPTTAIIIYLAGDNVKTHPNQPNPNSGAFNKTPD